MPRVGAKSIPFVSDELNRTLTLCKRPWRNNRLEGRTNYKSQLSVVSYKISGKNDDIYESTSSYNIH